MNPMTTQEAAALLRRQDNILILTHRRPDGDTIGCAAGLCQSLRQLGKKAFLLRNPDVTAVNAVYAEGLWAKEDFAPDFVVSVDIAAKSLFFPAAEAYFDQIGLAVDHHPSFEGFGRRFSEYDSYTNAGTDSCNHWRMRGNNYRYYPSGSHEQCRRIKVPYGSCKQCGL